MKFPTFAERHADKIRPEVLALAKRGNVTLEEWKDFRGNSYEMEILLPVLSDEAFIDFAQHNLDNCFFDKRRPYASYNEACMGFVAPELLRRFKALLEKK